MIRWWIDLWDRREAPTALALVRIGIAVVLLYDLFLSGFYGLPALLWAPREAGGVLDVLSRDYVPHVYRWLPGTAATAIGLYIACLVSLAAFGAGLFTRFSGLVFLLVYAQTAMINNTADRGIDRMLRIVILILLFSRSGDTLSIDARRRTGRWLGDGTPIPSWPRYLIVVQLVVMYWCAGIEKFAVTWFPWGGYSALFYILQDPIFATHDWSVLAHPLLYPLTQIGTAVSHLWEWTIPLLLLSYWYRDTRHRPGRVRAFFNRAHVRLVYVVLGLTFHILLHITLRLGIFPAAMIVMYPVFFHPDEIHGAVRRVAAWTGLRRTKAPLAAR